MIWEQALNGCGIFTFLTPRETSLWTCLSVRSFGWSVCWSVSHNFHERAGSLSFMPLSEHSLSMQAKEWKHNCYLYKFMLWSIGWPGAFKGPVNPAIIIGKWQAMLLVAVKRTARGHAVAWISAIWWQANVVVHKTAVRGQAEHLNVVVLFCQVSDFLLNVFTFSRYDGSSHIWMNRIFLCFFVHIQVIITSSRIILIKSNIGEYRGHF